MPLRCYLFYTEIQSIPNIRFYTFIIIFIHSSEQIYSNKRLMQKVIFVVPIVR